MGEADSLATTTPNSVDVSNNLFKQNTTNDVDKDKFMCGVVEGTLQISKESWQKQRLFRFRSKRAKLSVAQSIFSFLRIPILALSSQFFLNCVLYLFRFLRPTMDERTKKRFIYKVSTKNNFPDL